MQQQRTALNERNDVATVGIDLSAKAFDSVCHNLLVAEIKAYGFKDSELKLLQAYLDERKQRVKCNEKTSDWPLFKCGVPQETF